MVRGHRHNIHAELAAPPAIDQVRQTVVLLRGQDQHLALLVPAAQGPFHLEFVGDGRQGRDQRFLTRRTGIDHDAHEEASGFLIVELLGVENIDAVLEQGGRNAGHDARAVDAGEGQDHEGYSSRRGALASRGGIDLALVTGRHQGV